MVIIYVQMHDSPDRNQAVQCLAVWDEHVWTDIQMLWLFVYLLETIEVIQNC